MEREPLIGAAVLVIGLAVLSLAYRGGQSHAAGGYDVTARFNRADGISIGSEVRFAGLDVGAVTAQKLNDRYQAVLTLSISPDIQLPSDSAALIETDGLFGSKFIALQPGSSDTDLKPGGEVLMTQDSMNLNDLLELIISQGRNARAAGHAAAAGK